MTDPYQPTLASFQFTLDEQGAVDAALKTSKPWDWKPADATTKAALKSAKGRILDFHMQRHRGTCCYCKTILEGSGPFMRDREHILPKSKAAYRPYSYTIWNLAIACKRCNMQFKGSSTSFTIDAADTTAFQSSANYLFVHPNFDDWEIHLTRVTLQVNAQSLVAFRRSLGSAKADYTYAFFGLAQLQVDSFDRAQGGRVGDQVSELARQVRELADSFGQ